MDEYNVTDIPANSTEAVRWKIIIDMQASEIKQLKSECETLEIVMREVAVYLQNIRDSGQYSTEHVGEKLLTLRSAVDLSIAKLTAEGKSSL
jgi:hypothetical protein